MLWSLLKIVLFVAIAAAFAYGVLWIIDTPGHVLIAFAGREYALTPIAALIGLLVLLVLAYVILKLVGFLVAVVRFLLGNDTALNRYFRRRREERGLDSLADGLVAVAAGDSRSATRLARKAERLLGRSDATRLLNAQAAELAGDRTRAIEYYKEMLGNDRTRFVGIKGLMQHKLETGDTTTALALAKQAFALRPDNPGVLTTLFDLQSRHADWAGARETMLASRQARLLPRDVATRRDAVLSLADARAAFARGDTERGDAAALQANKLAPTLIPAAALAAEVLIRQGHKRRARKVLVNAWTANPHPELAAAFAAIEPNETPAARRQRFQMLISANPDHPESHLLAAELALADEDFPAARRALGDLAEREPTARSLALMAAIERGQGAPEAVVRGWLAKALGASRGPQWVCAKCSHVHAAWTPVCDHCRAFDTLNWKLPPHVEDPRIAGSATLPLLIERDQSEVEAGTAETARATEAEAATEAATEVEAEAESAKEAAEAEGEPRPAT